jgi:phage terminase large subunit-like protein
MDGHGYVLEDASQQAAPIEWARRAVALYKAKQGDRIVAEINNGGEMVEHTLRTVDANVPVTTVHATRGKVMRAEPISALYEQKKIHHVGMFAKLEDQLCAFTPDFDRGAAGYSPDRLDALVWAFTDLFPNEDVFDLATYMRAWG